VIEQIVVTLFPAVFLVVLFGSGERFRRRQIDMDGDAPINRTLFYTSKYLILALWLAMVMHTWGVNVSFWTGPKLLKWAAVVLWIAGFLLLFSGRLELGTSFRIGQPKESTSLRMGGLYRVSRNPMYVGVYATLLASVLRTLNPVLLLLSAFVVVVHHRIVLAEEGHLRSAFGKDYVAYCSLGRRYL
jgi:protein-S-isoprenylcysteine O-methyltransferase Ste14